MLGGRKCKHILRSIFERRHYAALLNSTRIYPDFTENAFRYLMHGGQYPYEIRLRTPVGLRTATLYSHHDIHTVNEIFCRLDYYASENIRTVVDIGSNIGISALYFLTRNKETTCFLYEPDGRNTSKLRKNLVGFEDRYRLVEAAVSSEKGTLEFGIEPTGRYGGIGVMTGATISVQCFEINEVIGEILEMVKFIDVLKIDTEGVEEKTVEAIDSKLARRIKHIFLECHPSHELQSALFRQDQYGGICRMINKFVS